MVFLYNFNDPNEQITLLDCTTLRNYHHYVETRQNVTDQSIKLITFPLQMNVFCVC